MDSRQIADIMPGVREMLLRDSSWCVTFESSDNPNRWLQFTGDTINAAYPHTDAPQLRLNASGPFSLTAWKENKYVTGRLALQDAESIARWIDDYLNEVLGCEGDCSLTLKFVHLNERGNAH